MRYIENQSDITIDEVCIDIYCTCSSILEIPFLHLRSLSKFTLFYLILQKHDEQITQLRSDFERQAREIEAKYEKKMRTLRDELDLRRKTEIHEIEERKNGQINELMKTHEKAFTDIKNYYNDITLNNLSLINTLKVGIIALNIEKLLTFPWASNDYLFLKQEFFWLHDFVFSQNSTWIYFFFILKQKCGSEKNKYMISKHFNTWGKSAE